jgi:hypothetical protein
MGMIQNSLEGDEKERKLLGSAFPKTTTTREEGERKKKKKKTLGFCVPAPLFKRVPSLYTKWEDL